MARCAAVHVTVQLLRGMLQQCAGDVRIFGYARGLGGACGQRGRAAVLPAVAGGRV